MPLKTDTRYLQTVGVSRDPSNRSTAGFEYKNYIAVTAEG